MRINKSFINQQTNNNLLYLIATPIGNLKEMTPRALEVISSCDIIAAEDTRNAKDLLAKFDIYNKQFISVREHNEVEGSKKVIEYIANGKKVCYVSDAGYPAISDPGNILVKKCIENDIKVSTISGSSAGINALVSSGLPSNHFYFHGFLPAKEVDAIKELNELKNKKETMIFYESPHRIGDTLKILFNSLGDREAVIGRELTKLHEEYIYGTLKELINIDPNSLKGEMVILIHGNDKEEEISDEQIIKRVKYFLDKGLSKKDSVEIVTDEYKVNKNRVKELILK